VNAKLLHCIKSRWLVAGIGVVLGAVIILGARVAAYHPEKEVHYHANFAVYLNEQREQFKSPVYYTDIEGICSAAEQEEHMTPHERAHMHDNINSVVHVEDAAVTWGQFFQNLGWVVDGQIIKTPAAMYVPDGQRAITFMLNGKEVSTITQRVIQDEDKLLVSYGAASTDELQREYKTIPSTAHHYDITPDPESCSGHKGVTMRDRMRHMF
jgi:hypothetical protein